MARKRRPNNLKPGRPPNRSIPSPAHPAQSGKTPLPRQAGRILTFVRWISRDLAVAALMLTVAVGAWMYYPRDANFLSMGIRVESDCTAPPTVKLGASWMAIDSYTLTTSFDYPADAA